MVYRMCPKKNSLVKGVTVPLDTFGIAGKTYFEESGSIMRKPKKACAVFGSPFERYEARQSAPKLNHEPPRCTFCERFLVAPLSSVMDFSGPGGSEVGIFE